MKTLNISSPVGQRLAEVALFERLQATFNLHPGKMAEDIKKEARLRQINCITLARELKECSVREFVLIFGMIATNCNGRELVIPPAKPSTYKFVLEGVCLQDLIHRYFGLSPDVIWANIHSKAKAEKIRVEEFADYLHQEMPSIVVWAFDQTIEILRKR